MTLKLCCKLSEAEINLRTLPFLTAVKGKEKEKKAVMVMVKVAFAKEDSTGDCRLLTPAIVCVGCNCGLFLCSLALVP